MPAQAAIPASPIASARAAERTVVLGYVPAAIREGFAGVLALDDALAGIVRTTREPIVGQMRLTWWYDALEALDDAKAPVGEPVLTRLAGSVMPRGVSGRSLAAMIDGWEILLSPDPIDRTALQAFGLARGGTLFAALAILLGARSDPVVLQAGQGWALADLAMHLTDPVAAGEARAMAKDLLATALHARWPRALRPLGMLALLARADIAEAPGRPGSPRRLGRLLMHRIWGR